MTSVNEEVARRSEYTAGLRKLADLLDRNPEMPLPDHGDTVAVAWFATTVHGAEKVREVLSRISGWKRTGTFAIDGKAEAGAVWRTRVEGLMVQVETRADVLPKLDGARDRSDTSRAAEYERIATRRFGEGLR